MPMRRTESPSHGGAPAPLNEAPPSILTDLTFLAELLTIARGGAAAGRGARPATAATTFSGESAPADGAGAPALTAPSRSPRRLSASSQQATDNACTTQAASDTSDVTEEEIVWQLTSAVLRCREAHLPHAASADPAGSAQDAHASSASMSVSSPNLTAASTSVHDEAPQAYWTDMTRQVHVDHLVEAIRYCAVRNFPPLKAHHVLSWWLRYDALVRSGAEGDLIAPPAVPDAPEGTSATADANLGSPMSGARNSHAGSAPTSASGSRKGHGNGAAPTSSKPSSTRLPSSSEPVKTTATPSADGAASPDRTNDATACECARPYLEVLEETLERFALEEVEMWRRWELVPRQPKERDPALAAAAGVGNASGGGGAGKKKLSEKTRLLLQMEEEEEERRQAAIASLPPQNVFLSEPELEAFLNFFARRGWLPHAHLYRILACRQRPTDRPTAAASGPAAPPLCPTFRVIVEQPMPVMPLSEACLSARSAEVVPELGVQAAHPTFPSGAASGPLSAVTTTTTSANTSSTKTAGAGGAARTRSRSNTNTKKPALHVLSRAGSDLARDEQTEAAEVAETAAVASSPVATLRARQEAELAVLERQHADWCAREAEEARLAQLARDMELHFERKGTEKAVHDVYEDLESQLTERELRILQRVEALERTLGMRPAQVTEADEPAASAKPPSRGTGSRAGGARAK